MLFACRKPVDAPSDVGGYIGDLAHGAVSRRPSVAPIVATSLVSKATLKSFTIVKDIYATGKTRPLKQTLIACRCRR